jgi:hypothetical protein
LAQSGAKSSVSKRMKRKAIRRLVSELHGSVERDFRLQAGSRQRLERTRTSRACDSRGSNLNVDFSDAARHAHETRCVPPMANTAAQCLGGGALVGAWGSPNCFRRES